MGITVASYNAVVLPVGTHMYRSRWASRSLPPTSLESYTMSESVASTIAGFKVAWEPPSPVNGVSGPPDILLQGSDDAIVKAHKAILSCSTEMFSAILAMDVDEAAPGAKLEGLDLLRLDRPAAVVGLVVAFCYNIPEPDLDEEDALKLLSAYKLAHRFTALRSQRELGFALYSM